MHMGRARFVTQKGRLSWQSTQGVGGTSALQKLGAGTAAPSRCDARAGSELRRLRMGMST